MNHRDLTGDDVLQAGDEWYDRRVGDWFNVPLAFLGRRCGTVEFASDKKPLFRRPLTPTEITAAERVKYIKWASNKEYLKKDIVFKNGNTEFRTVAEIGWRCWCAAVNCDPMGDV